jgi:broad specificity phosphatase PhoE
MSLKVMPSSSKGKLAQRDPFVVLGEAFRAFFASTTRPYDPPLTPLGMEQARDLARYLQPVRDANMHGDSVSLRVFLRQHHAKYQFQHILSSPLLRCVQTAAIVASELDLSLVLVPGLAECVKAARRLGVTADGTFDTTANLQQQVEQLGLKRAPAIVNMVDALIPKADTDDIDDNDDNDDEEVPVTFTDAALAAMGAYPQHGALLITHREGLKEMAEMAETAAPTRKQLVNCVVGRYKCDVDTGEVAMESLDVTSKAHVELQEVLQSKRKDKRKRQRGNKVKKQEELAAKRAAKFKAKLEGGAVENGSDDDNDDNIDNGDGVDNDENAADAADSVDADNLDPTA